MLNPGFSYPAITVTVNVAPNAPAHVDSQSSVSGGGSTPASFCDTTTILQSPVLSVSETHSGNFTQGQTGVSYMVTVSNRAGAGATRRAPGSPRT